MTQVEKMWKSIEEIKGSFRNIHRAYSVTYYELLALCDKADASSPDAIMDAFRYGFIKGERYQKAQEKKKRKVGKV